MNEQEKVFRELLQSIEKTVVPGSYLFERGMSEALKLEWLQKFFDARKKDEDVYEQIIDNNKQAFVSQKEVMDGYRKCCEDWQRAYEFFIRIKES